MSKVLALALIILLALASVTGYLFLAEKIIVWERQISDGQRELEKGQPALDKGKAKKVIPVNALLCTSKAIYGIDCAS